MRTRILLILLLATTFLVKPYKASTQVIASDSLALLDIINDIPGLYYSWEKIYPISTWAGVKLSADGTRVIRLNIARGTQQVDYPRSIKGVLSSSIGNLDALTYLSVADAAFTDSTLPATIGNLKRLTELDLTHSNLSSLPPTIGNLSSLTRLDVSYSLMKTLPAEIGNLSKLTFLGLVSSKIATLPPGIGNLHLIQNLDLSNIPLTKIPPELGNMSGLIGLNITKDSAFIDSLPSTIGNLNKLQTLTISNTTLKGSIPGTLGNLNHLKRLVLFRNTWTGRIEPGLGTLDSLVYLYISENTLKGNIPPDLGNLARLDSLTLICDSIQGAIPAQFGHLKSLRYLYVTGNNLTGPLPPELGNMSSLQSFNLYFTKIGGSLPPELGNLSSLQSIDIYYSNIGGHLPPELGNLSNLQTLTIAYSRISGTIPATFAKLPKLNELLLYHDQLDDSLPSYLGQFHNVAAIALDYNQIPGPIPPEFGNIGSSVKKGQGYGCEISLSHNKLTGTIPPELGNLFVWSLDLSYNQLTGPIPPKFDSLNGHYFLPYRINLSNNRFDFGSLEQLVDTYPLYYSDQYKWCLTFFPQATLPLTRTGNVLSVQAGDTINNNYYNWYSGSDYIYNAGGNGNKPGSLTITRPGAYHVLVGIIGGDGPDSAYHLSSDTVYVASDSLIMPARPSTITANYEYTDTAGWTHYCYDNNTPNDITDDTLLLSLKKNGQYIGTVGNGTFSVKLLATAGAGSNTGVLLNSPLITNSSGYYVMNRYWQVTPTYEPAASVGVRFYYNNQDLADVNGSYPTHNLTNDKLIFYKAVDGNPDPTTNLAGATKIISIMPAAYASDTTWTYHRLSDSTQYGEYSVASFSGGGGGGTGNNFSLPVTLLNFTAARAKTDVNLNWQTAQEINAANYFVERSQNGFDFTGIGTVAAMGNSTVKQSYSDVDRNAAALNTGTLYYRLKIIDKDGSFSYSKIVSLQPDGIDKALILYPNPAHTSAIVQFTAATAKKYTVAVTAADGKVLRRINIAASAGSNRVVIDVHDLPQATYLVNITGNKDSKTLTLVKQ